MKHTRRVLIALIILITCQINAQESGNKDYIEFNDRKNIIHGIYLGFDVGYSRVDKNDATLAGLKLAYVANKKMELGITIKALHSELPSVDRSFNTDYDLLTIYGGIHSENTILSVSRFSISIPFLIGLSHVTISDPLNNQEDIAGILESGVNLLFNLSRYIQFETGIKYRYSTPIDPVPNVLDNINGFSIGVGVKMGVFNLNKNRYKKKAPKD